MTEDEAKTKACPFAKNFSASQQVADGPGPHCVASACMAWRTREPEIERRNTGLGRMPVEPYERYVAEGWRQVARPPGGDGLFYERTISEGGGYCGLAGAPR